MKLVKRSPEMLNRKSRNLYSFIGKTKSDMKKEKVERLRDISKRRYDASTALTALMGLKIQRHGRRILVGPKGVTAVKK